MTLHQLYLITGKGGVGKTTIAKRLAQKIAKKKDRVALAFIEQESETPLSGTSYHYLPLKLNEITLEYMARKLNSKKIAQWINATPLFQSIYQMLPAMEFMLYFGKTLDVLRLEPQEFSPIIFDAPASGHLITMLESLQNFQTIFKSGILFKDAQELQNIFSTPGFAQIQIITLPTKLAMEESIELKQQIKDLYPEVETTLICNQCLSLLPSEVLADIENSSTLFQKLSLEKEILEEYKENISLCLPFDIDLEEE